MTRTRIETVARRLARNAVDRTIGPGAGSRRTLFYPEVRRLRPGLLRSGRLAIHAPGKDPGVSPDAFAAAERVLGAYQVARRDGNHQGDATGLWGNLIRSSYGELLAALESADPRRLAAVLEAMFTSTTTTGLSMGAEVGLLRTKAGRDFYVDWWLDSLLCLGAYLGIGGETMEDGRSTVSTVEDLDRLYLDAGTGLGISLSFPAVAGAWGIEYRGNLTPRSAWRHIHAANYVLAHVPSTEPRIVEVGGGFGGVAFWLQRMRPSLRYVTYDFPIVNVIAGYFLLRALPGDRILLADDTFDPRDGQPHVAVMPHWRIANEPERGCDIALNQDSLPEMPRETAQGYLRTIDRIVRVGFYSENHEGAERWDRKDPTSSQLRLPELETSLPGLERTSRHRAWMRRGYVETFYRRRSS